MAGMSKHLEPESRAYPVSLGDRHPHCHFSMVLQARLLVLYSRPLHTVAKICPSMC